MKLKSLISSACLSALLFSNIALANQACMDKYQFEIKNNKTVGLSILKAVGNSNALPAIGYLSAGIIVGTNAAAVAGFFVLPLAIVGEHVIEDSITDKNLQNMINLINESQYLTGAIRPTLNTTVIPKIAVDGATRKIRRAQKKTNRRNKSQNKAVQKANRNITKNLASGKKMMGDIQKALKNSQPNLSIGTIALIINEANENDRLCNGEIQNSGKNLVEKEFIAIDAQTEKERRKQRKENKKIAKYNKNVRKNLANKALAKKKKLVQYINSHAAQF
jgi:hypothetical protein